MDMLVCPGTASYHENLDSRIHTNAILAEMGKLVFQPMYHSALLNNVESASSKKQPIIHVSVQGV